MLFTDVTASYENGRPHILRYDLATNITRGAVIQGVTGQNTTTLGRLGFILPFEGTNDLYAVGVDLELRIVQWDGESTTATSLCTQFQLDPVQSNFVHMGHVDPRGVFFWGTLRLDMCNPNVTLPPGGLVFIMSFSTLQNLLHSYVNNYQIFSYFQSRDGRNTEATAINNLNIPNDFVFDEDRNVFYYVDSCNATINAADYNPATGALCKTL